ncbi:hypothetical protein B808_1090 [Fructilactobacillus florum 8D]|uniref:Cysteine desulfurase n=1 Tax=Fructilactobacillus florum 8D TaxID=1221538 RepID=W9ED38_9LACO|nr:hypothetical protein [Fructilactobacillus florum]ETO39982.1 hypothetical protein B808_1090 [Fructilactobacillus florum 8D]
MQFKTEVRLPNSPMSYRLNPEIKVFTLLDLNFTKSKRGNYELQQSLGTAPGSAKEIKLKLTISNDLTTFKMAVVDSTGLQTINIFKQPADQAVQERFNFTIRQLVLRKVLTVTKLPD